MLKKSLILVSVGVGVIGLVLLLFGSNDDLLVKVVSSIV